jgi:hypothetical protein
MLIAIQPDNYGPGDAASPLWTRLLLEAGHQVREVNVYHADILEQLQGCQGFMWRHAHLPGMRQIARRLLPVIEKELGLVIYPDQNTCWHYDDKIAQYYLLQAAGIQIPKTWVWFDEDGALGWAQNVTYPLVMKLWAGAGSTNVKLVNTCEEAEHWIHQLFANGVATLDDSLGSFRERVSQVLRVLKGEPMVHPWELHKNYILFQEFLPNNSFDTRVTVIGERAFGFRRFNRDNDFRASGSGKIDYTPEEVSPDFIKLAFEVAHKLNTQSCAIDGLWSGKQPVVGEISYTYASWAVHDCPGYWDTNMVWHEGHMWPEEAQIQDFVERLNQTFRNF